MTYRQPRQGSLPESSQWLDSLDQDLASVCTEQDKAEIHRVCELARRLLDLINANDLRAEDTFKCVKDVLDCDRTTAEWRKSPSWTYKTIPRPGFAQDEGQGSGFPPYIQLHPDIWIAYEWNYHRTGRIILHRHLLECLDQIQPSYQNDFAAISISEEVQSIHRTSLAMIHTLVDEVLSTVPQSLGDVDHSGNVPEDSAGTAAWRAIGSYFLLWPIKIIQSLDYATSEQRKAAQTTYERIREHTGMKTCLGELSNI